MARSLIATFMALLLSGCICETVVKQGQTIPFPGLAGVRIRGGDVESTTGTLAFVDEKGATIKEKQVRQGETFEFEHGGRVFVITVKNLYDRKLHIDEAHLCIKAK